MFCQFPVKVVTDHPCLDPDIAVLNADRKDFIHPGEVNDDPAFNGNHSSAEAGPRAPGNNRNLMLIGKFDDFSHLFG